VPTDIVNASSSVFILGGPVSFVGIVYFFSIVVIRFIG